MPGLNHRFLESWVPRIVDSLKHRFKPRKQSVLFLYWEEGFLFTLEGDLRVLMAYLVWWFEWKCPQEAHVLNTRSRVGSTVWGHLEGAALFREYVTGGWLPEFKDSAIPVWSLCFALRVQVVSSQFAVSGHHACPPTATLSPPPQTLIPLELKLFLL